MSNEIAKAQPPSRRGKFILQLLLGGLAGGVGMFGLLTLLDARTGLIDEGDRMLALGTGLVYALTGLLILIGVAAPRVGAQTLNVEDADEISEQSRELKIGSASFLLTGLFLGSLALVPGDGIDTPLTREAAMLLAGASFLAATWLSIRYRNLGDELMKATQAEANTICLSILFVAAGLWAILFQLGNAPTISPLLLVGGLYATYLLSVFIAAGRRGMLATR